MKNIVTKIINDSEEEVYVKKDISLFTSVVPLLFNEDDFISGAEPMEIPIPDALENLVENYNVITSFSSKHATHYDDKTKELIKDIVKGLKEWQEELKKHDETHFVVFKGDSKNYLFNPVEAKKKFLKTLLIGKLNYTGLTLSKHIEYYEMVKQVKETLLTLEGISNVFAPTVGENLLLLVGQKEVFRTRASVSFKEESFEFSMIESELQGFVFSTIKDLLTPLGYHVSFIKVDYGNENAIVFEVIKS